MHLISSSKGDSKDELKRYFQSDENFKVVSNLLHKLRKEYIYFPRHLQASEAQAAGTKKD